MLLKSKLGLSRGVQLDCPCGLGFGKALFCVVLLTPCQLGGEQGGWLSDSNRQPDSTACLSEAGTFKTDQITGIVNVATRSGLRVPLVAEGLDSRALEVCCENPGCRHGILEPWDHSQRDDQCPRGVAFVFFIFVFFRDVSL